MNDRSPRSTPPETPETNSERTESNATPNEENAMNASDKNPTANEQPENTAEIQALFTERYDNEAPAGLLGDILAEIPAELDVPTREDSTPPVVLGSHAAGEFGPDEPINAVALPDRAGTEDQGNVVRGRFGRLTSLPPQALAAAAALVVLIGAGWLALRLPSAEERMMQSAPTVVAPPSFVPPDAPAPPTGVSEAEKALPPGMEVVDYGEWEKSRLESARARLQEVRSKEEQLQQRLDRVEQAPATREAAEESALARRPQPSSAPSTNESQQLRSLGYVSSETRTEQVTVVSEAPMLDERRLNQGTAVEEGELEKIPTAGEPRTPLSQTPGTLVDRTNVGGSESGQRSIFRDQNSPASPTEQDAAAPPPMAEPAPEPPPRAPAPPPRPVASPTTRQAAESARLQEELRAIPERMRKEKKSEQDTDAPADSRFERLWTADDPTERGGRVDLEDSDDAIGEGIVPTRPAPPLTDPRVDPQSTFGLDVDTGSYTAIRAALRSGRLPDPSRIRPEEVLNWFRFDDPAPDHRSASDFAITSEAGHVTLPLPGATSRRLVRFSVNARDLSAIPRKPAVLTFVVDTSGSMQTDGRLETVKQALGVLLDNLEPRDRVALIAYSNGARLLSQATADKEQLRRAIRQLYPSGSTNLQSGMQFGYAEAERAFVRDAINRVILLSDGIANVGETQAVPILQSVADWAQRGIELTTIGVGMQHNDELLERLADRGDGNYAYVDTFREARRVFEEELTGTLQTIASDVRAQVTFDPSVVAGYRLIGYDNRALPDQMFRNDNVDAGEIGSGHRVTVLYEVELWADRQRAERAGDVETSRRARRPAATLDLRWRSKRTEGSGEFEETRVELPLATFFNRRAESPRVAFAGLIAAFAEELSSGRPSPQRLEQMADRVEKVAPLVPEVPAGEVAFLMREAADLARR